ncbi:type I polyketide synthase [Streptomyces profundus]|uniref:type I polyketide synthase n=1 Tax=Streptomyces profundus TaxID=2867410 RepID=UPI001D161AD5|nr:type I polyketide synthase [Streptomyces sp. MA3_2.13]UED87415.1 SDR family NAD(P)-dependent oxidoreductase [Streptomyces sp. MA3_2.13]
MTKESGRSEGARTTRTHGQAPIAVVGVACRLPGAVDPTEFWRLLRDGVDAVGELPESRARHVDTPVQGGFLDRVDLFDPEFFGISPREAVTMDPQQRLMLELAWEALENAGTVPDRIRDSRTAVYASAIWDDYAELAHRRGGAALTHHTFTGTRRAMLANRVSYALGLRGPSLTVDTGQSSSLVAVHLACESLRAGEIDAALVGGVNLVAAPGSTATSARMGALAASGRCRTFDAGADGYVRGEGGAALLLKTVERAVADGDTVYCVIRGSAVNNDGGGDSLGTPRPETQEEVLRLAYERAGTDPRRARYVELHGTGTPTGDPVEAAALGAVVGAGRPAGDPLPVGSVKTNVGHLEGAAGIVGLLKVALSIHHRELPPSLHFTAPNPRIPLDRLNLRVRTEHGAWAATPGQLVAGVSSFGLGGTNCHVVLADFAEGGRATHRTTAPARPLPWVLTGRDARALAAQADRLRHALESAPGEVTPGDVGLSLATTRAHFAHRAVVVGADRDELLRSVADLAANEPAPELVRGVAGTTGAGPVLVFPGQGAQWAGMGLELAEDYPVFGAALGECAAALSRWVDWDVWEELRGDLSRVDVVQPLSWAVMVSLGRLWESFGVTPAAVVGHSQGEIAAAVVAGGLSLDDGARVVAVRSRVIARKLAGRGAMASVGLSVAGVEEWLDGVPGVSVAAVNGPDSTVVAGGVAALEQLLERWEAAEVRVRRVAVDYASHSEHVEGVREELAEALAEVRGRECRVPLRSTVTGEVVRGAELDAGYWVRNLRQTVRFADAVRALIAEGHTHFVEASPHPVLCAPIVATAEAVDVEVAAVGSLRRQEGGGRRFLASVAEAWARGVSLNWETAFDGLGARRVHLPTYAFQRDGYWLPEGDAGDVTAPPPAVAAPDRDTATPAAGARAGELATGDRAQQRRRLLDLVRRHAAAVLGQSDAGRVAEATTFKDAGFDSHMSVELRDRLGLATGLRLPSDTLFSFPTPATLAERLRAELAGDDAPSAAGTGTGQAGTTPDDEPIAIVGMACRFPGGVESPEDLWRLVAAGEDAIGDFPTDRAWDLESLFDPDPEHGGTSYTRQGGFLGGATGFDPAFFGISPREALTMDPQQRLLLEVSWEAIERAGMLPETLRGTPTGVFVGAMAQEYGSRLDAAPEGFEGQLLTGSANSVLSGRIAYTLGLKGPAITVDTACSSSLVSLHLAAQALRQSDCSIALAGGVAVMASPGIFLEFSRQRGLSPDGRCKAFAAGADGTGWAEGVGMLVLERLSEARRNGHRVLAVVRGSAINQDGASNGLTAPNGASQQEVIRRALATAGLTAGDVDAVEAHGTGTTLGDPIEAHALLATYGQGRTADDPLYLGSLKSNIGHAQAAAGVGGVIKMVMAMRDGSLPRTLHVDKPSSHVDWTLGAVSLLAQGRPWPERDRPRRAGVSSFGISGTNAHVILEQAAADEPADEPAGPAPWPLLWPLSGASAEALAAQAARLGEFAADDAAPPADIGLSLATTRAAFRHRAVVTGRQRAELLAGLAGLAAGEPPPGVVAGQTLPGADSLGPVFVFPGQGSQWIGMGLRLADEFEVFRQALADCEAALAPHVDWSLREVLADEERLARVDVVQPALWAVMVSLARLWESFGVRPAAVVGHSQGEIAAAVVAGALSLTDAARVVALRSRAIRQRLAGQGGMASVALERADATRLLAPWAGRLSVAAVNGPHSTVVAGEVEALEDFVAHCEKEDVRVRRIAVDYASHSAQVEILREELLQALDGLEPGPVRLPFVSTVTGKPLEGPELDADYWYTNLRSTVEFADTVATLIDQGHGLFVESSAHPVLAMAIEENADAGVVAVGTLRRDDGGADRFVSSLAQAWAGGADVDWAAVHPGAKAVDLPTYAFQHQRYWLAAPAAGSERRDHPLAETVVPLAEGGGALLVATLSRSTTPWLADHAVDGRALLPGTGFIELALRAGAAVGCGRLAELTLKTPLWLPERGAVRLQIAVAAAEDAAGAAHTFTAHSRPVDADQDAPWTSHATGVLAPAEAAEPAGTDAWPPAEAERVDIEDLYPRLAALGYHYGPAFQGVRAAWRRGDEVFTEVALAPDQQAEAAHHGLHPALLDAALHGALLDSLDRSSGQVALPFAFAGVEPHATGATTARVRITPQGPDTVSLRLTDAAGRVIAVIESLEMRAAQSAAAPVDGLYRIDWVPAAEVPPAAEAADRYVLDPDARDLSALPVPPPATVVLPVRAGRPVAEAVGAALTLLTTWLADERLTGSRLVFALTGDAPEQAAVAGLVRTAQNEQPGRFTLVHAVDDAEFAVSAVAGGGDEPEVRVNGESSFVPRLARATRPSLNVPERPWRLGASGGAGDIVVALPSDRAEAPLAEGQVRVAVGAAGLNFRDLVVALEMVAGLEGVGVEGAGTVVEAGPGVTRLAVGDRVMGMLPESMGPLAVADARTLIRLPDGWTFEQGASAPVTYLTVWLGLVEGAGLGRGDRVLIHAATGGLGLAAVRVARHLGAEVFATASPAKHHHLRALGLPEDHIANSRSLDFRDRFLATTGGEGVDVVMNVLAGDFTDASLDLLPRGGRFVEMGKTDIRDAATVAAAYPGVRYQYFDLMSEHPDAIAGALERLAGHFADGDFPPPPITSWPMEAAPDAFHTLQRAQHVGKLVLTNRRPWHPDRTVLITGGTGTLGALLARHLVTRHGVRHLLLTSRRGPAADGARELVEELTALGAEPRVVACDAADRPALTGLLAAIPGDCRLGAVIHAAGLLDDATVEAMTVERVQRVLRAKTEAALLLDELTRGLDLDAFVLYSSVAGVLGTAGQANYAAANAALDALARDRHRRGLPAVSLAWGLWQAASGMTGHLDGQDVGRLSRTGVAPLEAAEGLALFDQGVADGGAGLVAARLDLAGLREQAAAGELPAVLRGLVGTVRRRAEPAANAPTTSGDGTLAERLSGAAPAERRRVLLDLVRLHAATVLRHGTGGDIAPEQPFRDIGFDSLTAVELRNRINAAAGLRLPSTVIFRHPTPAQLADRLATELFPQQTTSPSQGVLTELDRLSTALREIPSEADDRRVIGDRLRELLSEFEPKGEPTVDITLSDGARERPRPLVDEDLLALIDKELGTE